MAHGVRSFLKNLFTFTVYHISCVTFIPLTLVFFYSVVIKLLSGHRVKIHKITPTTDNERDDLEIKDYVVLQKPQEQADRLPPPRTLIMDFILTHTRFGRSSVHPIGQLTHTRRSDGAPEPDGTLKTVARAKIIHYRQLYLNRPDPIAFMHVAVDTSGRIFYLLQYADLAQPEMRALCELVGTLNV